MRILTRDEMLEIVHKAETEKRCPNCGSGIDNNRRGISNSWSTVSTYSFRGCSCWECDYAIQLVIEGDGVTYTELTPRKMLRTKEEALEWLKQSPDNALGICNQEENFLNERFQKGKAFSENAFILPYELYKAKKCYKELNDHLDTDEGRAACPYCRAVMEDADDEWEDCEANECWRCSQKYKVSVSRTITFSQTNKK